MAIASLLASVGLDQISRSGHLSDILLIFTAVGFFIPLAVTFAWQFIDGTPGPNRFGPDPKGQ